MKIWPQIIKKSLFYCLMDRWIELANESTDFTEIGINWLTFTTKCKVDKFEYKYIKQKRETSMKNPKAILYLAVAIGFGTVTGYWVQTPSEDCNQAIIIVALALVFIGIAGLIGKYIPKSK